MTALNITAQWTVVSFWVGLIWLCNCLGLTKRDTSFRLDFKESQHFALSFFRFVCFEKPAGICSYYQHSILVAELLIKRVITPETFCNFYTALIHVSWLLLQITSLHNAIEKQDMMLTNILLKLHMALQFFLCFFGYFVIPNICWHLPRAARAPHYTVYTQKNGAVSKVNKKFISHLTRTQRTQSAAANVQVSHALPAVPFSCLLRGQFPRWRRSRKSLSVCSVLRCPDL